MGFRYCKDCVHYPEETDVPPCLGCTGTNTKVRFVNKDKLKNVIMPDIIDQLEYEHAVMQKRLIDFREKNTLQDQRISQLEENLEILKRCVADIYNTFTEKGGTPDGKD